MAWRPEVIADSHGEWTPNGLRFATKEESDANAADLMRRWYLVTDIRSVEVDEPVRNRWDFDQSTTVFLEQEGEP